MRVVTSGEAMLRLVTSGCLRTNQACVLEMTFGGSEANVAVAPTQWGDEVARLPHNPIADA